MISACGRRHPGGRMLRLWGAACQPATQAKPLPAAVQLGVEGCEAGAPARARVDYAFLVSTPVSPSRCPSLPIAPVLGPTWTVVAALPGIESCALPWAMFGARKA